MYKYLKLHLLIRSNRIKFFFLWLFHTLRLRHLSLRMDPIIACNLSCLMCYFSDDMYRRNNKGKFTAEQSDRIAEIMFPYALQVVLGCATEPSLYKEFTIKDSPNNYSPRTYLRRHTVIDINTADTTAWIALPGIGNKLAARIVNFRDKLGGFYSIDQVAETYGLADSVFQPIKQYLKLENKSVKKININTATVDQLKTHPYIRYALANSIITYRNEHGIFPSVNDLRKIMAVTDNILNKVSPYLTVEK